jgi:hypothetical protein
MLLRAMINFKNYRWAARLTGFVGMVLIVSFMIGEGFPMLKNAHASYDLLFLLTLFVFSFIAYVVGWVIEIVGGAMLSLAGIALGFYIAFSHVFQSWHYIPLVSLPFLLPGLFFLMSWRHKILRTK